MAKNRRNEVVHKFWALVIGSTVIKDTVPGFSSYYWGKLDTEQRELHDKHADAAWQRVLSGEPQDAAIVHEVAALKQTMREVSKP